MSAGPLAERLNNGKRSDVEAAKAPAPNLPHTHPAMSFGTLQADFHEELLYRHQQWKASMVLMSKSSSLEASWMIEESQDLKSQS